MALDQSTVKRIATLARIRVPDTELDRLAGELSNIMGWIEQLGEVDTDGIEPMTSVAAATLPMRVDRVSDGGCPDQVLANAPGHAGAFFAVPKVVE